MRKISFVPLRAGSKEIVGKNTKILAGKPLFCWILDTIIASNEFNEIWISTDCPTVIQIIQKQYPKVQIHRRSRQNASDTSPTIDVVMEFLSLQSYGANDWLVLFQATSPFTNISDIQNLCRKIELTNKKSALACFSSKQFRWSLDGIPLDYQWKNKPRRQDNKGMLLEAGSFYASKITTIINSKQLISTPAEMIHVSNLTSFEIDTYLNFEIAEAYIKRKI